MFNIKKAITSALVAVLAVASITGCTTAKNKANTGSGNNAELNSVKHLNIAYQPAPGYLPIQVARDNGWVEEALKEAGYSDVVVTFTEFESGPPENESFAAGQQDVGVMGNVPSILGKAAGQDRTYIGISANGEETEAIVVPADSDIKSIADLKGKKIGLVVGSICENLVYNLLATEGLTLDDVELVNLATSEQQVALETGEVDAIATWQPTLSKITKDGNNVELADGAGGIFLAENTIFGNSDYIKQNPEIVQIFIRQYARAAYEVANNKEEYAKKYVDKYGLDEELLYKALKDDYFPIAFGEIDIEDLQKTSDFLFETGKASVNVNVRESIDESFGQDEQVQAYLKGEK